jgi:probable F420-dependent oxidoreductase
VRLDIVLPNEGKFAEEAVRAAPQFEDMGFEGLWLTDHVVGLEAYKPVYGDEWLEILTTLGFLAASTSKIRLGTGVLVAPYRDPVLQAKMLATVDILSGGRLDVGIGTGWSRREFQALGRSDAFEPRGKVTDDMLEVFVQLCRGGEHSFEYEWSKASKIRFEPPVKQNPHPPLWIGARGLGKAPMRRAAKYADVWHPTGVTPDEMREGGEQLDAMAGRKIPRSIRMQSTDPAALPDLLRRYEDAGCIQAAIDFKPGSLDELRRSAEALMNAVASGRAA